MFRQSVSARRVARGLLVAMVSVALAGCGGATSAVSTTHTPTISTEVASGATPSGAVAPTATPAPYVCANPAGSSAIYAYIRPGKTLALASGCSSPAVIAAPAGYILMPEAFSPGHRWLMASDLQTQEGSPGCDALVDTGSRALTPTPFCNPDATGYWTQWYAFAGWASDSVFYETSTTPKGVVTLLRVSVPGFTRATVTTFPWVGNLAYMGDAAGIAIRGDNVYYAGYHSATDHATAWLRRYSLSTGADTAIAALGIAGTGVCQVTTNPCAWTGSWDISPDGSKIAYHIPGPTQSPSDVSVGTPAPLYLANSDGSGVTRLFSGLTPGSPVFSPDGRYVAAMGYPKTYFERLSDGAVFASPDGLQAVTITWSAQPGTVVLYDGTTISADYYPLPVLFHIEAGGTTPLQTNSSGYLWALG